MQKKSLYLTLLFLCLYGFSSCKKGDSSSAGNASQISKVTLNGDGYNMQYLLSYNTSGQVSRIAVSGDYSGTITYKYSPQYKVVIYDFGVGALSRDSALLSNGKTTQNIHIDENGDTTVISYSYDGSGNPVQIAQLASNGGGIISGISYTWQGANVVSSSSVSPNNTTTYSYDVNTSFQAGDYVYVTDLLNYGSLVIVNKNLLTGYSQTTGTGGTTATQLMYDKDSKGRIIKCSEIGQISGTGKVWSYEYNN